MKKKQIKMKLFLPDNLLRIFIIAACFCLSCSNGAVYDRYQPVSGKVWNKQSEYYFKFEIKDRSIPYNISLQIRNNDRYAYRNLWLICKEQQPGDVLLNDTIECMLADEFGKWKSSGITLFQHRFALREHYLFPDTGRYTISLRHGMRDDNLTGIEDVGLSIEKAK
jgi:gliding motility-associated lipoprotein GldH